MPNPPPAKLPVYVIDDDEPFRTSLTGLLEALGWSTHAFESVSQFRQWQSDSTCGVLLLDLRMPKCGGMEFLQEDEASLWRLGIVVVTAHGDIETAVRAMKANALDFLEKPFTREQIEEAICSATEQLLVRLERGRDSYEAAIRLSKLSPRESEVLEALVQGSSNKQIAYELSLSARTVEMHRARLMQKLGVRNAQEAVGLAILGRTLP